MTVPGEVLTPFNVAQMLSNYRIRFVDEIEFQDGIAMALRDHSIGHQREYRLTPHDRRSIFGEWCDLETNRLLSPSPRCTPSAPPREKEKV